MHHYRIPDGKQMGGLFLLTPLYYLIPIKSKFKKREMPHRLNVREFPQLKIGGEKRGEGEASG